MSSGALSIRTLPSAAFRESKRWIGRPGQAARNMENLAVSGALALMVVLPLAEAGLRRTLHVSIAASTTIVQHMVLVVGMLGGAIAAREGRLLTLSSVGETALKGRLKEMARVFTSAVSAAVCAFLCLAAYQFVRTESESPKVLALGIPVWVVEWILPLGFGVIALRILRRASEKWALRAAAISRILHRTCFDLQPTLPEPRLAPQELGVLESSFLRGARTWGTIRQRVGMRS